MANDVCSRCEKPVTRGKGSRPEIICRDCRARPCGTLAAYYRHLRLGEEPCDLCRQANRDRDRKRNRERGPYGAKKGYCSRCSKPVWRAKHSRPEVVCNECRRKNPAPQVYRPRWIPQVVECPTCGIMFEQRRAGQKYCCRDCRQRGPVRVCVICGADYVCTYAKQRACSRRCGVIVRLGPPKPPPPDRECDVCGTRFRPKRVQHKRCSRACTEAANLRSVLDRYRTDPGFRDRVISRAQNRNARKLGIGSITSPAGLTIYLMQRDHGRCGICRKPIRAKKGPRRPSIDHIVPLSRGGQHVLENLQAAHYICNLRKGNVGGGEQLLLVG